MNAGFSNLAYLKNYLLAGTSKADTRFDSRIQALGLGVVGQFAQYTNREWMYAQNILEVFSADRPHWFTRRNPVTQFTKVEIRYFAADAWANITAQPVSTDEEKGYIDFGYMLGRRPMQVRLTYNGGYWWEQLEPDDPNYPSTVPSDITANQAGIGADKFMLPAELFQAWLTQCEHVWTNSNKLGTNLLKAGADTSIRFPEDWAANVENTLKSFKRFQLT